MHNEECVVCIFPCAFIFERHQTSVNIFVKCCFLESKKTLYKETKWNQELNPQITSWVQIFYNKSVETKFVFTNDTQSTSNLDWDYNVDMEKPVWKYHTAYN